MFSPQETSTVEGLQNILFPSLPVNKCSLLYIVSVKVQFFCLSIGQNRIMFTACFGEEATCPQ